MSPEAKKMERVDFSSDDVGVMLLESITQGLYHNPLNSIREYVQNEFDAGARTIRITIAGDKLTITGNGSGMSEAGLLSARKIGFSSKDPSENVGFRGIGIWSGVAICDELLVSTKLDGPKPGHILKIDAKGLRADIELGELPLVVALSRRVWISSLTKDEFREKHGTSVELRHILPQHLEALGRENLLSYAQQILPVSIDPNYEYSKSIEKELKDKIPDYTTVRVLVNDIEVFRPPTGTAKTLHPVFRTIENTQGRQVAVAWYALSVRGIIDTDTRYVVYKKKGFTVGDQTRSNLLILRTADLGAFAWSTGEIHVIDDHIIPTSERVEFESNSAFADLETRMRELLGEIVREVRKHQAGSTAKDRLEYLDGFRARFLGESDPEERLSIFMEASEFRRLLDQDVSNPRLEDWLRKEAEKARKKLIKDLRFMATSFDAPMGTTEKSTRGKRKQRKQPAEKEKPDEDLMGKLGAYFPFDELSLKLMIAVISAIKKLVKGNEKKMGLFIELLQEELGNLAKKGEK